MGKRKRMKKVADRRMISLPPELNDRMAKTEGVNWSAIAVRAFETELGRLAQQKEVKQMDDVIARLRLSKMETEGIAYDHGLHMGEYWAKDHAEAFQLQNLERLRMKLGSDWDHWFEDLTMPQSISNRLFFEIFGEASGPRDAMDFWEVLTDGVEDYDVNDPVFASAFAQGALRVWDSVKDQL